MGLILFVRLISWVVAGYDEATILGFEKKSEEIYQLQKSAERKGDMTVGPDFSKLVSRYPCIRGMVPVGINSGDGHKWVCGLRAITSAPVVFSFGSFGNQEFELDLLRLRPGKD